MELHRRGPDRRHLTQRDDLKAMLRLTPDVAEDAGMLDRKMLEHKDVRRRLPSGAPISTRTARPVQATPAAPVIVTGNQRTQEPTARLPIGRGA